MTPIPVAFAPGLFLVWFFVRLDKTRPEPLRLVLKTFALGCLSTLPAAILPVLIPGGDRSLALEAQFLPLFASIDLPPMVCTTRYVRPTSAGTGSAGKRASGAGVRGCSCSFLPAPFSLRFRSSYRHLHPDNPFNVLEMSVRRNQICAGLHGVGGYPDVVGRNGPALRANSAASPSPRMSRE